LQIKTKIGSCHTADSKPVKQEVNGTVILPPLILPGLFHRTALGTAVCKAPMALSNPLFRHFRLVLAGAGFEPTISGLLNYLPFLPSALSSCFDPLKLRDY